MRPVFIQNYFNDIQNDFNELQTSFDHCAVDSYYACGDFYVRKMEWHDAFVILLELTSRNLLNVNKQSQELRNQLWKYL